MFTSRKTSILCAVYQLWISFAVTVIFSLISAVDTIFRSEQDRLVPWTLYIRAPQPHPPPSAAGDPGSHVQSESIFPVWNILQYPRFWNSSTMSSKHISRSVVASYSSLNIDHATDKFIFRLIWGFPGSSAGEESAYNARDTGLIPGSGIFPGEGIGYPHQYSWASLVAQMVKNLPAKQETWIGTVPWRRGRQPTSVFLPGKSHEQRSVAGYIQPMRSQRESDTTKHTQTYLSLGLLVKC